jgi:hypothetical protein
MVDQWQENNIVVIWLGPGYREHRSSPEQTIGGFAFKSLIINGSGNRICLNQSGYIKGQCSPMLSIDTIEDV